MRKGGVRKYVAILGFVLGIAGVAAELLTAVPATLDQGVSVPVALVRFLSDFAILVNIALVLVYAGAAFKGHRWLSTFRRPLTRAVLAACAAMVVLVYRVVLTDARVPAGILETGAFTLHYVTPILYLVWFAAFNRSGTLNFEQVRTMLAPPAIYLVYVMVRGAIVHEYPYGILDADRLGYAQAALNALVLLAVMVLLSLAAIAIDRTLLITRAK